MSWFTKAGTEVRATEAEVALEAVRVTGEAHVKAITEAAKVAGRKIVADAQAAAAATAAVSASKLVATAQATAQAAVAAATAAATPATLVAPVVTPAA